MFPVSLENLVSLGKMEGQDYQDPQAPKVILVSQELQGLQETQDRRVAWERWDFQEFLERKEPLANLADQASLVPQDHQGSRDPKVILAQQDLDYQEILGQRVNQALQDSLETLG